MTLVFLCLAGLGTLAVIAHLKRSMAQMQEQCIGRSSRPMSRRRN